MMKKSMLVVVLAALATVFAQGAMAQDPAQVKLTLVKGAGIKSVAVAKVAEADPGTITDLVWNGPTGTKVNVKAEADKEDYVAKWTVTAKETTEPKPADAPAAKKDGAEYEVKGAAGQELTLTAIAGFEVELKVGKNGKVTAKGVEELKDLEDKAEKLLVVDELALTITPASADYVAVVTLDGEVAADPAKVKITKKGQKVEVAFNLVKYEIKATAEPVEGGTITGAGSYEKGADVTLTATPAEGYEFVSWSEDGAAIADAVAAYTFKAEKDRTLVATFEKSGICGGCGKKDASKMMGDLLLVGITLMGLFTLGSLRKH